MPCYYSHFIDEETEAQEDFIMEGFFGLVLLEIAETDAGEGKPERETEPEQDKLWRKYHLSNMAGAEHVSSLATL